MIQLNTQQVAEIVERDDLACAIQHQLRAENILDPELREMWDQARTVLKKIERYLEDNAPEED